MPPKPRITREMIVEAAFEVTREQGIGQVNARTVSERLGCSTQPVMYHFRRIGDMKRAVYQRADAYHTEYITDVRGGNHLLEIGLNYIRFAHAEKQLFRLLFQSNEFAGKNLAELTDAEELAPVIGALCSAADIKAEQARAAFRMLFLFVHGYASMLANNELNYDESAVAEDLTRVLTGVICATKEK